MADCSKTERGSSGILTFINYYKFGPTEIQILDPVLCHIKSVNTARLTQTTKVQIIHPQHDASPHRKN